MRSLTRKTLMLAGLILVGSAGMTHAIADDHTAVSGSQGQVVIDSRGHCVRTQWTTDRDECRTQRTISQTRRAADLTKEERVVYFEFNRANLTPEAKDRLNTLAYVLKSDESVKDAKIIGYADRIGSVSYNDRLSQKRAETVRDYLVANGYTNASVTKTQWVGKSEPSTNCPATDAHQKLIECLQADRRVEVGIEFLNEKVSDNR